jgi:5-methylcytosine-specific restriction protein A
MGSVDFERNKIYFRRGDIHQRFGGQQQGGISTPASAPMIFAFTGKVGRRHGYTDDWTDDGVFCYFGEGQTGDMTFRAGNKAIRDHAVNGKDLLVFEMLGGGRVKYLGQFMCESWDYQPAPDRAGTMRQAIVFHLVPQTDQLLPEPAQPLGPTDLASLRSKALAAGGSASNRGAKETKQSYHERSKLVRAYVLQRADGVCESCEQNAPFYRPDGTPFLEAHHIRRLTDGGLDDIHFMGGVCPNCHRAMHYGADREDLNAKLQSAVDAKEAGVAAAQASRNEEA